MSSAARALGWFAASLSIRSWRSEGLSKSTPGRPRAKEVRVFRTECTVSRVTSVGAAQPCPTLRPEWTARNTTSETEDELRAIVKASFRWRVNGRISIRSICTVPRKLWLHMKMPDSILGFCTSADHRTTKERPTRDFASSWTGGTTACRSVPMGLFRTNDLSVVSTEGTERASLAPRSNRAADLFAEPNEQFVDEKPVLLRDRLHQPLLGGFRRLGPNKSEAVAYPMDVGVGWNPRLPETVHEHAIRGLGADLRQLDEFVVCSGDSSVVSVEKDLAHLLDLRGLLAVEADGFDQTLEIGAVGVGDRLRGIVLRKELLRRHVRHLVPGSLG